MCTTNGSFDCKVAVTVKNFMRGNVDRNGKNPVMLVNMAGKMPNRNVLSGTVAENQGFELGKTYLARVREVESNNYGRQFNWTSVKELDALEILDMEDRLGSPEVINVDNEEETQKETENETEKEQQFETSDQS